ncbi:S41 family peptidase [Rheinheimera sp. UJ63]|uniref:S41 family peptidase n=1 Tax=Rheinheimera sp. UJ63 TaxID=2910157 RepID=UPI001F2F14E0|nr:S41 family peptidase [Rheinheimera sp. UJ63]MCF4008699.1 S41 family peptidase [Rheinheimera sp. UJ63]
MKKFLISLLLYSLSFLMLAQAPNLEFSATNINTPNGWFVNGSEPNLLSDQHPTQTAQSLRLSRAKPTTKDDYAFAMMQIPFSYIGKTLTLKGWIKTEPATENGSPALWIRLNGNGNALAFANTAESPVKVSQNWQQVELSIDVVAEAESLSFGVFLSDVGEAYFADLQLTLDGIPIAQAKQRVFVANASHEFEQESGIRITNLTSTQQHNLAALGKVWGFIKYFHPESAKGNVSMDAELFRLLPQVLSVSAQGKDQILLDWIKALGEITPCQQCKNHQDAALIHPAQFWQSWGLSAELNQQLATIYATDIPQPHYWVKKAAGVGNPTFNEKVYPDINYQDSGFRLLTLYRLWNIIQYYSPYRDLTEQPWEKVLQDAIPAMLLAKTELEYQLALSQVIYAIHDTHTQLKLNNANLITNYVGGKRPPVDVRFVEQQAVVYKVYQNAPDIKVGDIITQINGQPVSERLAYLQPLAAASNEPTRLMKMSSLLLNSNEEQLTVKVLRGTKELTIPLPLLARNAIKRQYYYNEHGDTAYQRLSPEIGYIRLDKMADVDVDTMIQELADTKGLVIDIRNYPSQFVVFNLGRHLYPKPFEFVRFTNMQADHPGKFTWTPALSVGETNPNYYQGKIAILINEHSQSQSEYTSMALRGAPKAKVFGSTTAGADGNISHIPLPGGHSTWLSGIGVFYPDKTPTQRIGIVSDVEVKPTIAGIAAGRDEVLEQALLYLKAN